MRIYDEEISGWGNYSKKNCQISSLFFPPFEYLELPDKFSSFTPKGMGRSYGDACISAENGLVLETLPLNKFISFDKDEGLISAYSGVTLEDILNIIIPHGWFMPVVPGTRFITLGGAIASNINGKNHQHTGSIENFIHKMTIMTPKGLIECSKDNNKDLFYATLGGLGMTGLIIKASVKLKKITTSLISSRFIKVKNLEDAIMISRTNSSYEYSVTWIDCLAKGKNLGRGIVMLGNHTAASELPKKIIKPLKNSWKTNFTLPKIFPSFSLNPFSVSLFNFLYYNKQFSKEKTSFMNFENWFFPLDKISNWNIMYGKQGFIQYHFTIPEAQGVKGIREALELLSKNKADSFLAVLKTVKDDTVLLPFAIKGFSLALDIPVRNKEIMNILHDLDNIVLKYGGRLYMTKDVRLSPKTFRKMNPDCDKWLETVNRYSPFRTFNSMLAERIKI